MYKPTITEVLPLLARFLAAPGNLTGGVLHIVLEDYNVNDKDVAFCRDEAMRAGDVFGRIIASLLLRMSRTQRLRLAGLFGGLKVET